MSVLIKGGRVVTAADDYVADILVEGERISLIGTNLGATGLDVPADTVIDASGRLVLPGAVDPHTHLDMPFGGTTTADDVESGQRAAARGGTTTHVDFCIQAPGSSFADSLTAWKAKAESKQVIDMGYHIAVTDLREGGSLEELASLPDEGITSYKLFMAYKGALMVDDETLFRTMEVAAETGALVMVHAENGDAIDVLVKKALAAGHTEPMWHARTRPPETEGEATNRAIQLARVAGCALYVVHVSCREAVEPILIAREKGWDVWGETCTQYFFVDESFLELPDFEGAKYVYTPPPRDKANQDVLWDAVRRDTLSAISTDHCAFLWDGQKTMGRDDFSKIPNGGPGLENRLHMIHNFGVREGRIGLNRMVELLCTNPAKLFGLYPRKGTIAVGSDADLVVFDPEKRHTITAAGQQSRSDYNLYEGTQVVGDVETVLLRGNVIVEGGEVVGSPGVGQFVKRARFGEKLPSSVSVG
ncbi:MAG: dihydropyrimidinase [Actinobacteria bacterium]|jgi:dihydropyrimidinase|nr:dihydropyrimidinase [Actinomycetota bacterium]